MISVLVFRPNQQPELLQGGERLLEGELELTAGRSLDGLRWEASQFSQIL